MICLIPVSSFSREDKSLRSRGCELPPLMVPACLICVVLLLVVPVSGGEVCIVGCVSGAGGTGRMARQVIINVRLSCAIFG